jgi:hypothetical protein
MNRRIFVTTTFEATHQWSGCPHEDVGFLRHPHRHIFHVLVTIDVNHDDRDIEFIQFKRNIELWTKTAYEGKHLGDKSCEMIAEDIHRHVLLSGYQDPMSIEVSEDNENGAVVTWP